MTRARRWLKTLAARLRVSWRWWHADYLGIDLGPWQLALNWFSPRLFTIGLHRRRVSHHVGVRDHVHYSLIRKWNWVSK